MNKQKGFTIVELLLIVIVLLVAIGWFKNIIKLTECDFKAPYKCEVIHTVGVIPPVGMVTGWVNVGK